MKKLLTFVVVMICSTTLICAQAGVTVRDIIINKNAAGVPDGTYTVKLADLTPRTLDDTHTTDIIWYLSYKGKKVSDYYYNTTNWYGTFTATDKAVTWHGAVPKGHEKYVTVQLGKEKGKKDRRDDD